MIFGKPFYVLLYLIVGIILFIIFIKHFQKVFDECYKEKVDSGMAFFFFRCCHGEHRERCKHCSYYYYKKRRQNDYWRRI